MSPCPLSSSRLTSHSCRQACLWPLPFLLATHSLEFRSRGAQAFSLCIKQQSWGRPREPRLCSCAGTEACPCASGKESAMRGDWSSFQVPVLPANEGTDATKAPCWESPQLLTDDHRTSDGASAGSRTGSLSHTHVSTHRCRPRCIQGKLVLGTLTRYVCLGGAAAVQAGTRFPAGVPIGGSGTAPRSVWLAG